MSTEESTREAVQRISAALRTALQLTGLSQRTCESRLGLSTGYLTRIFAGGVQLRVSFVLEICRMLDLPPASFFRALFPTPRLSQRNTHLLRGLGALHPLAAPYDSIDVLFEATLEIRDAAEKIERYLRSLPADVLEGADEPWLP